MGDKVVSETVVGEHTVNGRRLEVRRLAWRDASGLSYQVFDIDTGEDLTEQECFDQYPTLDQLEAPTGRHCLTLFAHVCSWSWGGRFPPRAPVAQKEERPQNAAASARRMRMHRDQAPASPKPRVGELQRGADPISSEPPAGKRVVVSSPTSGAGSSPVRSTTTSG
jgi:hypothetical protein